MLRTLVVHIHSIRHHSIGPDLADPEGIQWKGLICQIDQKMQQLKLLMNTMIGLETCLFEGVRPHDSRILCPPNWVPFRIDKACSAQDLKHKNEQTIK